MFGKSLVVAAVLVVGLSSSASASFSVLRPLTHGNGDSTTPVTSADGRYVAFPSLASNLVHGDRNGVSDVFVSDLRTGVVRSASRGGNGPSFDPPALSADGRFVAFVSSASNLVPGDTNGVDDVFVTDMRTGRVERVSGGNGPAYGSPAMSADGRYVAFRSEASTLVEGDTNGVADVFLTDRSLGRVTRISTSASGAQGDKLVHHGLAMSADGRLVVFPSAATNLVPGDTNGSVDMFVKDVVSGAVERVNVSASGAQTSSYTLMPAITPDGSRVLFVAWGDTLVPGDTEDTPDIFMKDLRTKAITRVNTRPDGTVANAQPYQPSVSADGRFVVFSSLASNLVRHDSNNVDDVFLKDVVSGAVVRLSERFGRQGNNFSVAPTISADGRTVVFATLATNLWATPSSELLVHNRL
ncbi:TolB family protein [Lentzea aerocolonigenes]|uniref:TolB family protein n=1 Tax=Lentzea aerocolonigenes TaxID=68170 RepID=UPI000B31A60C|nr:PD40 domain-containing protein [Lentzea aerocolonigenes]MCP2246333.1 WD40-like Beta Propeller Repeat [Lentzea aerocolonigenes]